MDKTIAFLLIYIYVIYDNIFDLKMQIYFFLGVCKYFGSRLSEIGCLGLGKFGVTNPSHKAQTNSLCYRAALVIIACQNFTHPKIAL